MSLVLSNFETLPLTSALRSVRQLLALMAQGRSNSTGTLTLAANATTTTVLDTRIAADSVIALMPQTANAAAAVATTYIPEANRQNGRLTLTHANNAQMDRTFGYTISG